MPDRKINFCSKFAIKTPPDTIANADIGSLKSLHTFLKTCLYHMLMKFEQNCAFWPKKKHVFKPFLTKSSILEDVSVAEIIV